MSLALSNRSTCRLFLSCCLDTAAVPAAGMHGRSFATSSLDTKRSRVVAPRRRSSRQRRIVLTVASRSRSFFLAVICSLPSLFVARSFSFFLVDNTRIDDWTRLHEARAKKRLTEIFFTVFACYLFTFELTNCDNVSSSDRYIGFLKSCDCIGSSPRTPTVKIFNRFVHLNKIIKQVNSEVR